jgi:hypothetical protein
MQNLEIELAAVQAWHNYISFLRSEFHNPDIEAIECIFSCLVAHYFEGEPIWLFVIAPPGSGKTSIGINSASSWPLAHVEGDINMRAMMCGQKGGEHTSVLDQYGKSFVLLFKDFTSILSKKEDDQKELIGLFREMYDGAYARKTATRWGSWEGKATIIAAVTPAIERAWAVHRDLGERFMQVRWPNGMGVNIAARARAQRGRERAISQKMRELSLKIAEACCKLKQRATLTEAQGARIDHLASMIAVLRGHIVRDSHAGREIIEVSACEEPSRLAKSLEALCSFHAILWGRTEATEDDMKIAIRVGFDSIPNNRSRVVRAIPSDAPILVGEIRRLTGMVRSTIDWTCDELEAMGVLVSIGNEDKQVAFTPEFAETWRVSIRPPCDPTPTNLKPPNPL